MLVAFRQSDVYVQLHYWSPCHFPVTARCTEQLALQTQTRVSDLIEIVCLHWLIQSDPGDLRVRQ